MSEQSTFLVRFENSDRVTLPNDWASFIDRAADEADGCISVGGLAHQETNAMSVAATRFTARSESMERLSREEKEALSEFVKVLSE